MIRTLGACWVPFCSLAVVLLGVFLTCTLWLHAPVSDMWAFLDQVARDNGSLTSSHLLAPHNEHVIVIPRLLYYLDLRFDAGRGGWLIVITLICQGLHVLLWAWALHRLAGWRGQTLTFATSIIAMLLFHPAQLENFILPFQVQIPLAMLFASAAFICYSLSPKPITTALAACFGLASAFSFGAGLLVLPILTFAAMLQRRKVAAVYALLVVIPVLFMPQRSLAVPKIGPLVTYLLAYLASPLWVFGPRALMLASAALIAGVVYLGFKTRANAAARPLLMLGAMVLGSGLLTAISRASMGWFQAVSSRYTTIVLLGWMVAILLAALSQVRYARVGITITMLLLMSPLAWWHHALGASLNLARDGAQYARELREHRVNEALAERLNSHPQPATLTWLEAHRLSVFAP